MTDLKRYLNLKNVSIVVYLNGGIMSNRATRRKANSKKGGGFFAKNKLARNHGMRYEWIGQKEEQLVQKKAANIVDWEN